MADLIDVVTRRSMSRAFRAEPLPVGTVERFIDLASRAPSAGKSQGWHAVVLEGTATSRFWDATLPAERRAGFAWPTLLDAPTIIVIVADPQAYVDRYSEPDKAHTGLGVGPDAWPTPYWTVDSSMAAHTILLAAENEGLGALFFGVFNGEDELRAALDIPVGAQIIGVIALGYPQPAPAGRSASRPRRSADEIIHRGGW